MKFILFLSITFTLLMPITAHAYQDDLDGLLGRYVKPVKSGDMNYNGVDYDAWSQDKHHKKVRQAIQRYNVSSFKSKSEALAFWINAYNFFVVDIIIQKGERDSIQDLRGVESPFERYTWSVDGTVYTLKQIMDQHIRSADEPKAHFALSCAGKSCPDLHVEAYRSSKLKEQLDIQTKKFLQNKHKGFNVTPRKNVVMVSPLLDEYSDDFNRGNIKSWLQPYFPLFINAVTQVTFFDFDWSLNSQENID